MCGVCLVEKKCFEVRNVESYVSKQLNLGRIKLQTTILFDRIAPVWTFKRSW